LVGSPTLHMLDQVPPAVAVNHVDLFAPLLSARIPFTFRILFVFSLSPTTPKAPKHLYSQWANKDYPIRCFLFHICPNGFSRNWQRMLEPWERLEWHPASWGLAGGDGPRETYTRQSRFVIPAKPPLLNGPYNRLRCILSHRLLLHIPLFNSYPPYCCRRFCFHFTRAALNMRVLVAYQNFRSDIMATDLQGSRRVWSS
jgi:hypothetical protein